MNRPKRRGIEKKKILPSGQRSKNKKSGGPFNKNRIKMWNSFGHRGGVKGRNTAISSRTGTDQVKDTQMNRNL